MNKIRILCIDDDHDLSAMLDLYNKPETPVEHLGTVSNLDNALEQIAKETPEIVVVDLSVEGSDPLRTIQEISKRFPMVRIILYSNERDPELIKKAMVAGACKHVLKDDGVKNLLEAIYGVLTIPVGAN